MLEIRLLGQFSLQLDGRPVELPSRPAQALLAYLVLNAPRKQSRERLAGLIWPDADEAAGRQGLRNALWKLRAAVGEEALVADKLTIGLAEGAWWSDVTALLAPDEGPEPALARAVEAYAGELLPGFYEEWVALERERLSAVFERQMAALVARCEAAGRWREALDWAERWLARAGAAEPAYRTIMQAHAALGDRAGVGAAYRRCVAALEEDLGLPPSEATVSLYQRLTQEAAPPPPVASIGAAPAPGFLAQEGRVAPVPLPAAREAELAVLAQAFEQAAAGQGQIVLVTGEAGEGKSTLLEALTQLALERREDAVIARGACDAFAGESRAFGPFSEAFRMLAGEVEAPWAAGRISTAQARRAWALLPESVEVLLGRGRPLLGSLIEGPELAQRAAQYAASAPLPRLAALTATIGSAEAARLEQGALFDACAAFLLALAQARPVVLLLDDLHWMDASSAGLLLHLSRRLAGARLLIVGAFRPEESASSDARLPLAGMLGELKRTVGNVTLELGRRDAARARAFIDALLDREPNRFEPAFREQLARRTGGHALFTVELLNELKERGEVVRDEAGRWVAVAGAAPDVLPARVEGVLESRIGRLDEELRRALTIAAVEGEEFTAEVAARVAGADAWRLLERLASEAGRRHRLVDELGAVRAGTRRLSRFRFRHNLFQRFLYEALGPSVQPRLHEAVADALRELHGEGTSAIAVSLARHYLAAELPERALPHLLEAGRAANRVAAHREAAEHLQAALAALSAWPDGPARDALELDVRLELMVALHVTAGFSAPAIAEHARRAVALAEAAGDGERHFRALWNLWLYHVACFETRESERVSARLLEAAGDDPDRVLQAHHAAWSACHLSGNHRAMREHLAAGAALYDESRHSTLMAAYAGHDPGVCRLCYQARMDLNDGKPRQALARLDEALALAQRLGHGYGVAQTLAVRCDVLLSAEDYAEAERCAEAAIAFTEANGFPFWGAWAALARGAARACLGHPDGLEAIRAFSTHLALPAGEASSVLLAYEASACLVLGRLDEGLAAIEAGLEAVERTGEVSMHAELYRTRASLRLAAGEPAEEVEADLERAVAIAEEAERPAIAYRSIEALVRLWAGGPREQEARERLQAALARLPEPPTPAGLGVGGSGDFGVIKREAEA